MTIINFFSEYQAFAARSFLGYFWVKLFTANYGNSSYRSSLSDSASRGVVFRLRISPKIRSYNRISSKRSVRDLCRTGLCKNPRKSASLPCPLREKDFTQALEVESFSRELWTSTHCWIVFYVIYYLWCLKCRLRQLNIWRSIHAGHWREQQCPNWQIIFAQLCIFAATQKHTQQHIQTVFIVYLSYTSI